MILASISSIEWLKYSMMSGGTDVMAWISAFIVMCALTLAIALLWHKLWNKDNCLGQSRSHIVIAIFSLILLISTLCMSGLKKSYFVIIPSSTMISMETLAYQDTSSAVGAVKNQIDDLANSVYKTLNKRADKTPLDLNDLGSISFEGTNSDEAPAAQTSLTKLDAQEYLAASMMLWIIFGCAVLGLLATIARFAYADIKVFPVNEKEKI